jgi:hypothetical protein
MSALDSRLQVLDENREHHVYCGSMDRGIRLPVLRVSERHARMTMQGRLGHVRSILSESKGTVGEKRKPSSQIHNTRSLVIVAASG